MALKGAVDARIGLALQSRLLSDTAESPAIAGVSLEEHLRAAGALLTPPGSMPVFAGMAHDRARRPYIVYGPQSPQSEIEPSRCGTSLVGYANYQVVYIAQMLTPDEQNQGVAVVDRIAALLDGYLVTVSSQEVFFARTGGIWFPDFAASETGVVHTGMVYRVQVR
jgi:hypothetical protein